MNPEMDFVNLIGISPEIFLVKIERILTLNMLQRCFKTISMLMQTANIHSSSSPAL